MVAELQNRLKTVGRHPGMSKAQRTDQFEFAIGALEGALTRFAIDAAQAIKSAEASGNTTEAEKAKEKRLLMFSCIQQVKRSLDEARRVLLIE
ncbi:MAG: hypothetical protein R3E42_05050 [Burkholderiaceae bacterium]